MGTRHQKEVDSIGTRMRANTQIEKAIDELVDLYQKEVASLKSLEASTSRASDHCFLNNWGERITQMRGRPLFYPFLGSGAGRGPYVELIDGSVKLDLINGIGIHIMGHGHPRLQRVALQAALSDVVMQGNLEPNREYLELGEKLVDLAGRRSQLEHVWFSTCGTMANECALKIARQKNTPAKFVITPENAFAGRSTFMAEVTDNLAYKQGLPTYDEVFRIPFYNPKNSRSAEDSLRSLQEHWSRLNGEIACFALEPMLGEGGFQRAPREFFIPLFEFCREKGIAIWFDEVQTFMRTGELFAFETLDLGEYVDICTVAKTLQTGATFYTADFNPKPGLIAGTFSGSTVALSVGLEILKIITEEGYLGNEGKIAQIHRQFVSMLNELNTTSCRNQLRDAGGMGLMVAVTPLDGSKEKVGKLLQALYHAGVIAFSCGKDPVRLRFLLPAILQDEDIEVVKRALEKSISEFL